VAVAGMVAGVAERWPRTCCKGDRKSRLKRLKDPFTHCGESSDLSGFEKTDSEQSYERKGRIRG